MWQLYFIFASWEEKIVPIVRWKFYAMLLGFKRGRRNANPGVESTL